MDDVYDRDKIAFGGIFKSLDRVRDIGKKEELCEEVYGVLTNKIDDPEFCKTNLNKDKYIEKYEFLADALDKKSIEL